MIKHTIRSLVLVILFAVPGKGADNPAGPVPMPPFMISVFPAIPILPVYPQFRIHMSRRSRGRAMTAFSNADPHICLDFKAWPLSPGDKIRAVWFTEDAGQGIIKNSEACESTLDAQVPMTDGVSYIVEPKEGWPAGAYRVELYVDGTPMTSTRFSIKAGHAAASPGAAVASARRFWKPMTWLQASR